MQRQLATLVLAFAAAATAAGSAGAAVVRTKDTLPGCGTSTGCVVGVDTTWAGTDEIIMDGPVFVKTGATLTIQSGAIVRGQPRYAGAVAGQARGTAGSLIVTRAGKINAEGLPTAAGVIVFTSAAVDNDGDNVADDLDDSGYPDQYPGFVAPCVNGGGANAPEGPDNLLGTGDDLLGTCVISGAPSFLDDTPRTAPLAPLDAQGNQNNGLWGGVIVLGNAPTNTFGTCTTCTTGEDTAEGIPFPGYPEEDGKYGGAKPHDNSGTIKFVSIRHGGDEFNLADEVNGLTLGGVGDGTNIQFVDVYANYDDGFEWFGGTVNTHHLVAAFVGDDSLDADQGFTGVLQFALTLHTFFNERDCDDASCLPTPPQTTPDTFGTESGDQSMELDGDDCGGDCNLAGPDSYSETGNVGVAPWPPSGAVFMNVTHLGNDLTRLHRLGVLVAGDYVPNGACTAAATPYPCCTGSGTGFCTNAANSGIEAKAGFMGEIRNVYQVNMGGKGVIVGTGGAAGWTVADNVCADLDGDGPGGAAAGFGDLFRVVASTFDDVGAVAAATAPCNLAAGGNDRNAIANGDTVTTAPLPAGTSIVNDARLSGTAAAVAGLRNEDLTFDPTGLPGTNKLGAALKPGGKIDPKPQGATGFTNGTSPEALPVPSPAVTFRGAFPSSGNLWTRDWTALHIGGLLVD